MPHISIRAIVLATLAVIGVDIVTGVLLTLLFGGPVLGSEMSDEQLRAVQQALLQDIRYLTFLLILGTASTVLGGYLTARMAGSVPYFNALAFGVLGVILGFIGAGEVPTWVKVIGLLLTVPAALLGGHLAKLHMSKPVS
jgi:hypothetical protein